MEQLNDQELATILAALRNFQRCMEEYGTETMAHQFPQFDEVEPLSSEAIDNLCVRLNLGNGPDSEGLLMTLRDWRITDGLEADLPLHLRGDYAVNLIRGSYDNIVLRLTTPTGDRSLLHIEAEQDHFKLMVYCPDAACTTEAHDDCDAICRITRQGLIVYGNSGYSPALVLNGEEFTSVNPTVLQQLIGVLDGSTRSHESPVINLQDKASSASRMSHSSR